MAAASLNHLLTTATVDEEHPAVVELGRDSLNTLNRKTLFERSARVAGGLEQQGLEPGDRVVLLAPNSASWIISALGVLHAGAVVVPLDTQMPSDDLQHALKDCQPRFAMTTQALSARLEELDEEVGLFLLDEDTSGHQQSVPEAEPVPIRAQAEDVAALFYTSGTTGPPKGVPLTHDNIRSNVEALATQNLADSHDRVLVPLPFHHVYPFTVGILIPLSLGAPIIIPFSLVGPQILRALREGDATLMLAVPRLYEAVWSALYQKVKGRGKLAAGLFSGLLRISMLARQRFGLRLGKKLFAKLHQRLAPHLRLMVSGGAPLDPELGSKLQGLGWEVATGYGLSETSPILTLNPPESVRLERAGAPLPGVELSISADQDKSESSGKGEILARGPNVFNGYLNRPEKTKEDLDEQGWFHTGDVGWLDREGYLHIEGRKSAMIVLSGGENIDPERVEKTLMAADQIREAGVLAHQDRLAVVVMPEPGLIREVDGKELRQLIEQAVSQASSTLPSHHQPGEVRVTLDPLPRTRLGKLRRHKLKEMFTRLNEPDEISEAKSEPIQPESMAPEDQQLLSDPSAEQTWRYLTERFHNVRLTPDSGLARDLRIDSLSWVDLTVALREQAGIELDDAAISRVETVRDLLNEAAGAASTDEAGEDLLSSLAHAETLLDDEQKAMLEPRSRLQRMSGVVLLGVTKVISYLFMDLKVTGKLPEQGQYLIAPRHLSLLDPLLLASTFGRRRLKSIYWAGWTGILFSGPLMSWLSRCARVLPIDPGSAPRSSLAFAAISLERGNSLAWFPEGQRSPDGQLQAFKPGLGWVLRAQPVPVIPIWIEGTREVLKPGNRIPKRKKVSIVIGDPIEPEQLKGDEQEIAQLIQDKVAALKQAQGS